MFDKDNKFGFIINNNNENNNNIKNTNLPYTVSSKVLGTVPASNVTLDDPITVNNININKDRRYYIEFLGSKKLCSLLINGEQGNCIICSIGNYTIRAYNNSTNVRIDIIKTNEADTTTDTFTDLIIYEEEDDYIDSKYLETDLVLQNSISLGRIGDIGGGSSAIGIGVIASGGSSHAEGTITIASGNYGSHAEGYNTKALGNTSHAEGSWTTASGESSHTEGYETKAEGESSHAEGYKTKSSGMYSHSEGIGTIASGSFGSHAEGFATTSSGKYGSHAEGNGTMASSDSQHVQGKYNIEDTTSKYAHIVGNGTSGNTRSNAHTLDWKGNGWYAGEVQGTNLPYTISSKVLATVPASNVKLNNEITINNATINKDRRYYIEFLGSKKLCSLLVSEEDGDFIICGIGNYIIGVFNDSPNISININKINKDDTTATTFTDLVIYEEEVKYLNGKYLETDLVLQNSISLGRVGDIGMGSSAVGYNVEASNDCSHAEGDSTTASGYVSHAEGSSTTASGLYSHAEGNSTTASGESSHAEGGGTASGFCSHAEGDSTIASGDYQHVQGKYNIEDKANKYAHIVGNGDDDDTRSNAHTLDWEGNGWFAGKLSQEGTPTENKDLTTKKYVDDKVSNLPQFSFNENGELVVTINGVNKTFVPKE